MSSDLKKCFVEFIGTFFLCFSILCCVLIGSNPVLAPILIGVVLAVAIYAGGPISGGHYNPAVSLGIFLIGRMGAKKTLLYCIFQVFGAAYAALMILIMSSAVTNANPMKDYSISPLVIAEIVFTILLVYVVMFCAVSKRIQGNSYFGLAIGGALTVGIGAVGSICLAAFNPAVAFALGLSGIACGKIVLITITANLAAAVITSWIFKLVNLDDVEKVEVVGIDEFIRK